VRENLEGVLKIFARKILEKKFHREILKRKLKMKGKFSLKN
jgi:hypothetical protein